MHKKRTFIFILLALLLLSFSAFALDEQEAPAQAQQEVSVEAQQEPPAKLITAIEIRDNKAISTNTIISKMKIRIGSLYQENIISDDLKRLYLLGFFSDIKIDTEDYKEGVKVVISVVERPIIEKITFAGIKRITMSDEKLKTQLKSKETQYLDYPSLTEDVLALKKMYEKLGLAKAKVDYQVEIDQETNKARVQFNVEEGRRIRIKNISIEGNATFSARRILRLIKTRQAWFFNAGVLKEEVLKEDMERIKAFYHKEGFSDAVVNYEIKSDSKRNFLLYINIGIQEGRRYKVGNVAIQGNLEVTEKDILSRLTYSVPGKVFSQEALKQDVASIQALYFDRGYIFAQIQETALLNSGTSRVDILYKIEEHEVAYVDKIKIRGNVKTKDVVVRRELRIRPGDKFDGEKLRRSKERLQNLGFFEEISYDTEDTDIQNKKDLVVEVKEAKTGSFSFGGGFSTVDEFIGFVEVEQKNFDWKNFPYFTGAGQQLKFRASLGTLTDSLDLSFTEPWLFDYPVSFGFDAYKTAHGRESDVGYGYEEEITGGALRLGKEISEYVRASLDYRYDRIDIANITENATSDLKSEKGKNSISSAEFGLSFDSRDNVFFARKGDLLSGSFQWAGGVLGGDKDFYKFFGRASHYFALPLESSLELRGRVGLGDAYGDSSKIPIYERFFAGGANTIRGYQERKIGPVDSVSKDPLGGNSLLIGNVEYTYPLLDFMKLAAFYDAGNVWETSGKFASGALKVGVGLGMRLKTPIGPITLDYGIPLNKEPGEEKKGDGRFHFSASHGF